MTNDEINEANRKSAEREAREDWVKEQRRIEIGTEERFRYRRRRPQFVEETDNQDILLQIQRENVNGTQPGRG